MRVLSLPLILCSLAAVGLAVAGCAAPGATGAGQVAAAPAEDFNDPFEDTNRSIFGFNQSVDQDVLLPVAKAYRDVLPEPVRQAVHNFLQNLDGPVIFANDVLQGQAGLAGNTIVRLALNTTIGIAGIFDVAAQIGVPYHTNDLGITLATWGFAEGPYVIVPVLGPSNPRDIVGKVGDGFADPGNYVAGEHHLLAAVIARTATSGIDERSRNIETFDEIQKNAIDLYAQLRSLWRQHRASELRHGEPAPPEDQELYTDPALKKP